MAVRQLDIYIYIFNVYLQENKVKEAECKGIGSAAQAVRPFKYLRNPKRTTTSDPLCWQVGLWD